MKTGARVRVKARASVRVMLRVKNKFKFKVGVRVRVRVGEGLGSWLVLGWVRVGLAHVASKVIIGCDDRDNMRKTKTTTRRRRK